MTTSLVNFEGMSLCVWFKVETWRTLLFIICVLERSIMPDNKFLLGSEMRSCTFMSAVYLSLSFSPYWTFPPDWFLIWCILAYWVQWELGLSVIIFELVMHNFCCISEHFYLCLSCLIVVFLFGRESMTYSKVHLIGCGARTNQGQTRLCS